MPEEKEKTWWQRQVDTSDTAWKNAWSDGKSVGSAINILGGIGGIVGAGYQNAQINDTSYVTNQINRFGSVSYNTDNYNSLLEDYSTNYAPQMPELSSIKKSAGEKIGGIFNGALAGASAGSSVGGPIGAIVGGALGLGSGIVGSIVGDAKAQQQLDKLNSQLEAAKIDNLNRFNYSAGLINDKMFNGAALNYRAYGGDLYDIAMTNKHYNKGKIKYNKSSYIGNLFAYGGQMNLAGDWSNGVTVIGEGGSHETNPYDGVQVGVDQQGTPNLVEEGEVIFNDYVYSNRLKPTDKQIDEVKLKEEYKGKTFANIAKDIAKESEERPNDPISKNGLIDGMMKLQAIQEDVRNKKAMAQFKREFKKLSPEEQVATLQAMTGGQGEPTQQEEEIDPFNFNARYAPNGNPADELDSEYGYADGGNLFKKGGNKKTKSSQARVTLPDTYEVEKILDQYKEYIDNWGFTRNDIDGGNTVFVDNETGERFASEREVLENAINRRIAERSRGDVGNNSFRTNVINENPDLVQIGDVSPNLGVNIGIDDWLSQDSLDAAVASAIRGEIKGLPSIIDKDAYGRLAYQLGRNALSDRPDITYPLDLDNTIVNPYKHEPRKINWRRYNRNLTPEQEDLEWDTPMYIPKPPQLSDDVKIPDSELPDLPSLKLKRTRDEARALRLGSKPMRYQSIPPEAPQLEEPQIETSDIPVNDELNIGGTSVPGVQRMLKKVDFSDNWKPSDEDIRLDNYSLSKKDRQYLDAMFNENLLNQLTQLANEETLEPSGVTAYKNISRLNNISDRNARLSLPEERKVNDIPRLSNIVDRNARLSLPEEPEQFSLPSLQNIVDNNARLSLPERNNRTIDGLDLIWGPDAAKLLGRGYREINPRDGRPNIGYNSFNNNTSNTPVVDLGSYDLTPEEEIIAEEAGFNEDPRKYTGNREPVDNKSGSEWLRYMPVIGSGIQVIADMFGANKPDYTNAKMIGDAANRIRNVRAPQLYNYMRYTPYDTNYQQNRLQNIALGSQRNIMNTTSGNRSAALASLLYGNASTMSGMGDLYRQAMDYNNNQRKTVSDFNRGTDQINLQSIMSASQANQTADSRRAELKMREAMMRDSIDTASSQAISNNYSRFFQNMGNLGRDIFNENQYNDLIASGVIPTGWQRKKNGGKINKRKTKRLI